MIIIPIIIIILLLLTNKYVLGQKNYNIFNPISLCLYVWLLAFIVHYCYYGENTYTLLSYIIIISGLILMCVGFWIGYSLNKKYNASIEFKRYNYFFIKKIMVLFIIIELLRFLLYYFIVIRNIAGSWSYFFAHGTEVRNKYLFSTQPLIVSIVEFILNINAMVGYTFLGIYLSQKWKGRYLLLLISVLFELLFSLILMSKLSFTIFIFVIVLSTFSNIKSVNMQRKKITHLFPLIALLLFVLFMLIGELRNYAAQGNLGSVVISKIFIYFGGPIEAFGKYISLYDSNIELGKNTFLFIIRILSRLSVVDAGDLLLHGQNFISVGDSVTNVYTWYKTFYMDWSYLGCLFVPFILGFIFSLSVNKSLYGDKFLYDNTVSWIGTCLAFSFFTFLWTYTIYVLVLFYGVFVSHIFKNRIYLKE